MPNLWPDHFLAAKDDNHFSSGVNDAGEVEGLAQSGGNIGIAATHIRPGLLEALARMGGGMTLLFIDSGAFSEVEFGAEGRKIVDPISHERWIEVLALYKRAIMHYDDGGFGWRRNRLYVVAPDSVGDQCETLNRLHAYAAQVRELVELGARVIVPVQKGILPMADFFQLELATLGLTADQVVAGIPMRKDATTTAELEAFAQSLPIDEVAIHLLGLGPSSKKYAPAMDAIRNACPWADVTSDACEFRRMVGRTNGPGGGPRAITAAQDRARAKGLKGGEVKRVAVSEVRDAAWAVELAEAKANGWYDVELYSAPGVPLPDVAPCVACGRHRSTVTISETLCHRCATSAPVLRQGDLFKEAV